MVRIKKSLLKRIFLVTFFFLFCSFFVTSSTYWNPLTIGAGDQRYCRVIDGCASNATGNVTGNASGLVPHALNGTNHTGFLSSVRVIKDSGTNFLNDILDVIIDTIWNQIIITDARSNSTGNFSEARDNIAFVNQTNTFQLKQEFEGEVDVNENNITNIYSISSPDGSKIRFSADAPFSGLDQAITIISNQTLGAGVITHALLDQQGGNIIAAWQSGKNDSGHFNRNSMCVFPDFGFTNASLVTNCEFMFETAGITSLADYYSAINHTSLGILWALESQKLFLHNDLGNGQLLGEGDFRWVSQKGNDIDLYEGTVHIRDEVIREVGIGFNVTINIFDEDFETGSLGDFDLVTEGKGVDEWSISVDAECPTGVSGGGLFCARAGSGGGSQETIIQGNYTSNDIGNQSLRFAIDTNFMTLGGLFKITIDNNEGDTDLLYQLIGTNVVDDIINISLPSTMDNKSKITMNFTFSSTNPTLGETFIDDVRINGTTLISTLANQTFEDGKVKFGDGKCFIELFNGVDVDNLTLSCDNINLLGNVTQTSVTIVNQNVTGDVSAGSFTLDGLTIFSWFDIGNFTGFKINASQVRNFGQEVRDVQIKYTHLSNFTNDMNFTSENKSVRFKSINVTEASFINGTCFEPFNETCNLIRKCGEIGGLVLC